MMELLLKVHEITGLKVCEVRNEAGELVAGIYPTDHGIKIISPNFIEGEEESIIGIHSVDPRLPVPQLDLSFRPPGPYSFKGGKIVRFGRG